MKSNYKRLGDYIRQVDVRNKDEKVTRLLGVSIDKKFIESIANTIGTDMSVYKIVRRGQFAYGPVTSRNGDKVSIALLTEEECIISSSYTVFEIIDTKALLPEYLNLWFKRSEFDRYARFHSHGSAREIFDWEEMCNVELPIPSIEEQQKIVDAYETIEKRIAIKKKINENLEEQLYAWFQINFIKNLDYNQWPQLSLKEIVTVIDNRGKTPPFTIIKNDFPLIEIGAMHSAGRIIDYSQVEKYIQLTTYLNWFRSGHPKQYDILISTVGSLAELKLFYGGKGSIAQNLVAFRAKDEGFALYLYQYLNWKQRDLLSYEIGSVQASIKVSQIINFLVKVPPDNLVEKFNCIARQATEIIYKNEIMILRLFKLQNVLLSLVSSI